MTEIPPIAAPIVSLPEQAQNGQATAPDAVADFASLLAFALSGGDPGTDPSREMVAIQTEAAPEDTCESGGTSTPSATDAAGAELAALSAAASLAAALFTGPDAPAAVASTNADGNAPAVEAARPQGLPAGTRVAVTAAPHIADPASGAKEGKSDEAAPVPVRPEGAAEPLRETPVQTAPVTSPDPANAKPAAETSPRSGTVEAASAATPHPTASAGPSHAPVRTPADAGSAYAPLRPGAAGFAEAFCTRVQLEIAAGRAAASIEVSPPDLGPVELRILVADGAAHVACSAPHPAVREAIAQALPQLRDMLAAQGLALGETSVGTELPARDGSGRGATADGQACTGPREAASATPLAALVPPQALRRGLVDVFA